MKPLKPPGYTEKRTYTQWHQVPGHGLCPVCGRFARTNGTGGNEEFKIQHRTCECGNTFQTVVKK